MYIEETIENIRQKDAEQYKNLRLCYVGPIPKMITDYTTLSKIYMAQPGFSREKELETYGYCSPNLQMEEVPNKNFKIGESEFEAYFAPINESEVWGDDWNDCGDWLNTPYDFTYDEFGNRTELAMIKLPFGLPGEIDEDGYRGFGNLEIRIPGLLDEYAYEQMCIQEVNLGLTPWIWARTEGKKDVEVVCIQAGTNPLRFLMGLDRIFEIYEKRNS